MAEGGLMRELTPHVDEDVIIELREIMDDEFDILLETYLGDAATKLDMIESALEQNDREKLRESAHSLKGSSSNIGALPLSGLCANLEYLARENQIGEARKIIGGVRAEYERVKSLLEAKLSH